MTNKNYDDISDNEIRVIGSNNVGKTYWTYCKNFNVNCEHFAENGMCRYYGKCRAQQTATHKSDIDEMYRFVMRRDQLRILELLQKVHDFTK